MFPGLKRCHSLWDRTFSPSDLASFSWDLLLGTQPDPNEDMDYMDTVQEQ